MAAFLGRRLLQAVPVLFLSSVGIFLVLQLLPGDPALILSPPAATPEQVQAKREAMGLDRPLPVQYGLWLFDVVRGDLGTSTTGRPVIELVAARVPATAVLALAGMALAILIAIPAGVISAKYRKRWPDWVVSSASATAVAVPNFWFAILAIILFALYLGWLPPGGYVPLTEDPVQWALHLLLPALTVGISVAGALARFVRSSVLDVVRDDYVRTARSKGVPDRRVMTRHVLPNAMVPVVTVAGIHLGHLLGGAVIIEAVFRWNGIGLLLLNSIETRDYAVIQGVLLLLVLVFLLVNLLTDLLYGVIDPRIRLERTRA